MVRKANPGRNLRIADQIQRDLAELIQREIRDPRLGLVTLQGVELTPDYAHAKVWFTVLGAEAEVARQILNDKAGYLHALLFKRLHIHTVPALHFVFDQSTERAMDMNALIAKAISSRAKDD